LSPAEATINPAVTSGGHSLADYGKMLRRRWVYMATIVPGVLLLAVLVAFILPPRYRAQSLVMYQGAAIPKDMISTTVKDVEDAYTTAQQELELVRKRVMDPDNLMPLVQKIDPYPNRHGLTPEGKAEMLAGDTSFERVDPITGKPADNSVAFAIQYSNPDPQLAKKVAREITDYFLTFNQRQRVQQATEAYQFLQTQAKQLEVEMVAMEQKLAGFRAQYGGALPEMQAHNLQRVDALQKDVEATQQQLLVAEEKQSQLQLQLNTLSPNLSSSIADWRVQLGKAQADLIDAQNKYTPEHPEVKRLKREVAELRAQGNAGMKVGVAAPDNPDYLQVKSQLDSAQHEVAGLRAFEERARAELAGYEKNMTMAPNVQREYTQLQRDYDNDRQRYDDLQTKMKNAALAQQMEVQAKGEKFALLHEANTPGAPYFPNRLGIILLGFILGGGLGFGVAAMVDASDPAVRGSSELSALLGTAAIGTVPRMLNPADQRKRRLAWASAVVVYGTATALVAFVVLLANK
jgi:polysaccharide biosynthesis transport protein